MHTKEYRSAKFKIAKRMGVKSVFCLKLNEKGRILAILALNATGERELFN
jgi:hypothetical protein